MSKKIFEGDELVLIRSGPNFKEPLHGKKTFVLTVAENVSHVSRKIRQPSCTVGLLCYFIHFRAFLCAYGEQRFEIEIIQ